MRRLSALVLPVAALLFAAVLSGCAASAEMQEAMLRREASIDSLRQVTDSLRAENRLYADSLAFLDDIDSGQYYRDRRTLTDRIQRLRYERAVLEDGGLTLATLGTDDLFEPASATLHAQGAARLAELAETLRGSFPGRSFRVEGHSDGVPVGPSLKDRYPSNWELSAARAASVVRHLAETHGFQSAQFTVVAYGDTHPIASNETAAGRRANRRVRIAVAPPAADAEE